MGRKYEELREGRISVSISFSVIEIREHIGLPLFDVPANKYPFLH
jgi:hypothetical protein